MEEREKTFIKKRRQETFHKKDTREGEECRTAHDREGNQMVRSGRVKKKRAIADRRKSVPCCNRLL